MSNETVFELPSHLYEPFSTAFGGGMTETQASLRVEVKEWCEDNLALDDPENAVFLRPKIDLESRGLILKPPGSRKVTSGLLRHTYGCDIVFRNPLKAALFKLRWL